VNLEKLFFGDVHRVTSIRKKPPQKKSSLSFSGREIHLVLVFFYRGFLLFGTWNVGGCLLLWKGGFAKRKGGGKGGGGLGWVGEEWRKKGLGWVGTEEYTLGDCEKPHIALVVVWDIYAYLIRLDMICEPFLSQVNVVSVFSVRARSRTGFFSIFRSFFFCLARVSFFERERERERAWGCFVCWEVVL